MWHPAHRRSGLVQSCVPTECPNQLYEVGAVAGHDLVAVEGEQRDGSIDHVTEPGCGEQLTRCAPEGFVERANVDAAKCLPESCLTGATPPRLAEHAGMCDREIA